MWFAFTIVSALLWGMTNVGDSTLVKKYKLSPSTLLWVQNSISMVFLICIALAYPVSTRFAPLLLVCAVSGYLGDLFLFWILKRLDVSVVNAAWSILTVFLGILGFLYFKEQWTVMQGIGAVLVIGGMLVLSFFHAHVSLIRTFFLLAFLALMYVPAAFARKYSLSAGEGILPVFFWLVLGRDILGFFLPIVAPPLRRTLVSELKGRSSDFFFLCALTISFFYVSEYTVALAYQGGPVSLISVVANIQPFMVLFIAWIVALLLPAYAPKELFGLKSTAQKLISFLIVFIGLALLGVSQ